MGVQQFEAALEQLTVAIRKRRDELKLTQEDVAFEAGLSVRHYQQLESGEMNPTFRTLFNVAMVLKTTVPELTAMPKRR
jgi:transcriptional regulator with XRE-family HTH domain